MLYDKNAYRATGFVGRLTEVESACEPETPDYCEMCDSAAVFGRFCGQHYLADRVERFHAMYEQVPPATCWIWTGSVGAGGYGTFRVGAGAMSAHRFSWTLKNGRPVKPGMFICHACDVPACVNPDHLFEGTPQQNMTDAMTKGRLAKIVTPQVVEKVMALHGSSLFSGGEIARIVGVSTRSISEITNRRHRLSNA